jgi:hypothetical protein
MRASIHAFCRGGAARAIQHNEPCAYLRDRRWGLRERAAKEVKSPRTNIICGGPPTAKMPRTHTQVRRQSQKTAKETSTV